MNPTEKLIAELREANGKRTTGEWRLRSVPAWNSYDEYAYCAEGPVHAQNPLGDNRQRAENDAAFISFCANSMDKLLRIIEVQREALEYISCEGMDDGDFYAEEFITEGTISMANRARSTLAKSDRIAEGKE